MKLPRLALPLLFLGTALPAAAVPVTLTLDPAAPGVNRAGFTATATVPLFGEQVVPGSTDASGTIALDAGFTNGALSSIRFLDATDVGFTDVALAFLGFPVADTQNVRGTINSGDLAVGPGGAVDLTGVTLTLDEGFVDFIGDDPTNNDLSTNPLALALADGNTINVTSTDLGNGLASVVLSGPASFVGLVDNTPAINLAIAGNLLARGTVAVPEPAVAAAVLLAGAGLRRRAA